MVRALEYLRQTRSLVFNIFPLNEIDHYLFLSRARYHKNHFVLVKDTEYLNRRKRDNLASPFLQDQTNVVHHLWHKSFQLVLAMKLPFEHVYVKTEQTQINIFLTSIPKIKNVGW